jgi:uncharacterized integral membrane protein (TIGR00697 family)
MGYAVSVLRPWIYLKERDIMVWVYWIISLTLVTYVSSQIVKKTRYGFAALTGLYVVYLAASQVLATRIVEFNLGFYTFYAPSAVFIYPFVAQVTDMINEVYGRKSAHTAILIAFATQVLLVLFILMVNSLVPAPFFQYEDAWKSLFGLSMRITAASWVSFLICSNLDAYVFDSLKKKFFHRERAFAHDTSLNPYVWLRCSVSDAADLTLDSVIFVTLAYLGVMPVVPLIIGQLISKNVVGFLDNPWFVWYKRMLRQGEGKSTTLRSEDSPLRIQGGSGDTDLGAA